MTFEELLSRVKSTIGELGDYQDDKISEYIKEVLEFLKDSGISSEVLETESVVGVVSRGVTDLMYGDDFSPYFLKRAVQLAYKKGAE